MTTKAAIERGLADWSEKVTGAKQFGIHLEKRERERADAARRASQPSAATKGPRAGSPVAKHRTPRPAA